MTVAVKEDPSTGNGSNPGETTGGNETIGGNGTTDSTGTNGSGTVAGTSNGSSSDCNRFQYGSPDGNNTEDGNHKNW